MDCGFRGCVGAMERGEKELEIVYSVRGVTVTVSGC